MKFMYSCEQVVRLVSESLDKQKLPFWTRMQLWMHLGMCGICKSFRKHMVRVDEEARRHAKETEQDVGDSGVQLSPEARERLNRALKRGQ